MAIAIARMEEAVPLAGTAFLGGMSQAWLVRKYPEWSWILSGLLIAGGAYTSTRGGMLGTVGLGLMTAGAAGLGMALMPVTSAPRSPRGGPRFLPGGPRAEEQIRVTDTYRVVP